RADRHADRGRPAGRHRARPRCRRHPLSDQAVLARATPVAGRGPAAELRMAARVAAELQSLRYAEDVRRLYHQLRRSICQSLLGLANALEAKDPYTRGHSERVGAWSGRLATALGLPPEEVETITQAGLLHDIGKIGVPEAVLRKRGALTP